MYFYEHELREQLTNNLCPELTRHFRTGHQVLLELKVGSKIADMVLFDDELKNIIVIELKVSKWKDALRQAVIHQLWATESYVALSRKHINGALMNRRIFETFGVGMISVDGFSKVEISAKRSPYRKPRYLETARIEIARRLSGDRS